MVENNLDFFELAVFCNNCNLYLVCIAGPPNIAKTNSLKVALHMASSLNYFFSMKVGNI